MENKLILSKSIKNNIYRINYVNSYAGCFYSMYIMKKLFLYKLKLCNLNNTNNLNNLNNQNTYTYKFTTKQSDFKNDVRNIINNSGWNNKFNFKETIDNNYDIGIGLKSRDYMDKTNTFNEYDDDGNKIYFSRTWIKVPSHLKQSIKPNVKEIEIDENNWYNGVKRSNLTRDEYKKYIINHEVGHAIGYDHRPCKKREKCPIMYQMTKGLPKKSSPSYEVNNNDINYVRTLF